MTRNTAVTGYQPLPAGPQRPPPRSPATPDPSAQGHAAALRGEPECAPGNLTGRDAARWCEGWRLGWRERVEARLAALEQGPGWEAGR